MGGLANRAMIGILIIQTYPPGIIMQIIVSYFSFVLFSFMNPVLIFLLFKIILKDKLGIKILFINKINNKKISLKRKSLIILIMSG
jgi:hypothetical protein